VYLYFAADLTRAGLFDEASLAATTERHHIELAAPRLEVVADASVELSRSTVEGVVFELSSGLPSARHVRLIDQALRADRRAWLFSLPSRPSSVSMMNARSASGFIHQRPVAQRISQPVDNAVTRWHRVLRPSLDLSRELPSVAPTLAQARAAHRHGLNRCRSSDRRNRVDVETAAYVRPTTGELRPLMTGWSYDWSAGLDDRSPGVSDHQS
jgi:hypothetical protein